MATAMDTADFWWSLNPRVRNVGYYDAAPGYRYRPWPRRVRDFYVWYIAGGAGRIRVSGRWMDFREGDLVTILPGRLYEDERADGRLGSRIYFSHMLPLGRESAAGSSELARRWPVRVPCRQPSRMRDLFAELLDLLTLQPPQHPLRAKAIALEVFGAILSPHRPIAADASPQATAKVAQAGRFVAEHLAEPLTPERIAAEVNLSESYLFTLYRRHVGASPMAHLSRLRLRRSCVLLAQGLSVTQAAARAGFSSLHYFSRAFRQEYRQPPSQFARQLRRK